MTFTVERKSTIMALVCSKLTSNSNNSQIFATPNKYCALTRSYKDKTVLGIINVDISCDIEDKKWTVFAVIYIVLLLFDRINCFDFKCSFFIFETIIIRIIFLFRSFWFENICIKFRWLLDFFRLFFFLYLLDLRDI